MDFYNCQEKTKFKLDACIYKFTISARQSALTNYSTKRKLWSISSLAKSTRNHINSISRSAAFSMVKKLIYGLNIWKTTDSNGTWYVRQRTYLYRPLIQPSLFRQSMSFSQPRYKPGIKYCQKITEKEVNYNKTIPHQKCTCVPTQKISLIATFCFFLPSDPVNFPRSINKKINRKTLLLMYKSIKFPSALNKMNTLCGQVNIDFFIHAPHRHLCQRPLHLKIKWQQSSRMFPPSGTY